MIEGDGYIAESTARLRAQLDRVAQKVEIEITSGISCDTRKVVALGKHAINPLIRAIIGELEFQERRAAMGCLEEFGKTAVPHLIVALDLAAKRRDNAACFKISAALKRLLQKENCPEAMRAMIQVSANPDRDISESVHKNIEGVLNARALHFRKIIFDRNIQYTVEAGLGAVDMAISDLKHLCGGKLPQQVKTQLDVFRGMVKTAIEKETPRMKTRGAADGETSRSKLPFQPVPSRGSRRRAQNMGRAIFGGC